MPFSSRQQARFAFGTHQPWAERWARETTFAHLPRRARAKLRRQARTKAMTRSEAARHAALVRWGKEQALGDKRSAGNVRAATTEANRIRSAGTAAARALRTAAGVNRVLPKPKKGGGKKGGGKGATPKTPKTPKQTPQQRHEANRASVRQAMADSDQGLAPKGFDNLVGLAAGTEPDAQGAEALTTMGLAERGGDGVLRLTSAGRAAVAAANRGDAKGAIDAISRAGDQATAATARGQAAMERFAGRSQRALERQAAQQQRAQARAERQAQIAKRRAGSRGSSRQPADTSERDRIAAERLALAQQRFQAQQQRQAAQDAERQAQDAAVQKLENRQILTPAEQLTLVRAGLARETRGRSGGAFALTAAGQRRATTKEAHMHTLKAGSPGDYLVVEDREKPSTWHLQVRTNGRPDHRLMGAAWAALSPQGYRGNTYQGPNKTEAIAKLRALYQAEKMPVPSEKAATDPDQSQYAGYTMEDWSDEPRKPITARDIAAERARLAAVFSPDQFALAERLGLVPSEKAGSRFAVYKDAAGRYRWVMQSSNAFRDRDAEIVSTKALADDVARADQDRAYGPLRWWHVGAPFGPGLDLGECDFNAMVGRVLIESGTFRTPQLGAAVAAKADQLQGSIGFVHPPGEPDADGVFTHIRRFERSLVPRGKAANPFTSLMVKELPMDETKIKALAELLNIPDDQVQSLIVAPARETETKAIDAGVTFKAGDPIDPAQLAAALQADPALLAATIAALEGQPAATKAEAETKADGMPDAAGDMEAMAEGGMEEPGEDNMLTDAECQKIAAMCADMVSQQLLPHLGIGSKMDEVKSLLGSMAGGYAQKDAADAERTKAIADLKAQQAQLNARLKELEGDAPAAIRAGFKASQASSTIVDPASPLAQAAPKADGLSDFLSTFVLGDLGAPAQP